MKRRRPPRSFNALLFVYLLFVLLVSGALTGTSYVVLFLLGLMPDSCSRTCSPPSASSSCSSSTPS